MKAVLITSVCAFLVLVGCKKDYSTSTPKRELSLADTIKPKWDYSFQTNCKNEYHGYFYRFGFWISNYYTICDYNGNETDSIAVLSPKIMTPEASDCRDENEKIINSRLLIISSRSKQAVYENVIENEIGAGTCGGELIEMIPNGFRLYKAKGQGCKLLYKIDINKVNDCFYLSKLLTNASSAP